MVNGWVAPRKKGLLEASQLQSASQPASWLKYQCLGLNPNFTTFVMQQWGTVAAFMLGPAWCLYSKWMLMLHIRSETITQWYFIYLKVESSIYMIMQWQSDSKYYATYMLRQVPHVVKHPVSRTTSLKFSLKELAWRCELIRLIYLHTFHFVWGFLVRISPGLLFKLVQWK